MRSNLTKIIRICMNAGSTSGRRIVSGGHVRGRRSTTFSVRGEEMKPRSGCRGEPERGEQGMRAVEGMVGWGGVLIGVGTRGAEGISGYIRLRSRRSTLPRACEEKGPAEENSSSLFPRCLRASSIGVFGSFCGLDDVLYIMFGSHEGHFSHIEDWIMGGRLSLTADLPWRRWEW
ncbi:hypothetical protein BHM03_00060014 [Ensete ventricosum]|nr:hypothetical protein BHM03_00060014 [Ensete ventricosum]